MNKKEVQQRVLQNGKPLDLNKFEWDEKTNTFSSNENNLVLDFNGIDYCTFNIGHFCILNTGHFCTFNIGSYCTFNASSYCTFNTSSYCTFRTGSNCTFKTGSACAFNTGYDCTFDCGENCVVVRKDVYEVIELNGLGKIKLNEWSVKGYTKLEPEETIQIGDHTYSKKEVEERLQGLKEI